MRLFRCASEDPFIHREEFAFNTCRIRHTRLEARHATAVPNGH